MPKPTFIVTPRRLIALDHILYAEILDVPDNSGRWCVNILTVHDNEPRAVVCDTLAQAQRNLWDISQALEAIRVRGYEPSDVDGGARRAFYDKESAILAGLRSHMTPDEWSAIFNALHRGPRAYDAMPDLEYEYKTEMTEAKDEIVTNVTPR